MQQHVSGLFVVYIKRQVDAAFEQRQIDTCVQLLSGLPFQLRIGNFFQAVGRTKRRVERQQGSAVQVIGNSLIAYFTITEAEFQVGIERAHEFFVAQTPGNGGGWEIAPAVLRSEFGRTVGPHGKRNQVPIKQAVVETAEIGSDRSRIFPARRAGGDIVSFTQYGNIVGREVFLRYQRTLPGGFLRFLTDHSRQFVCFIIHYLIGQVVFPNPEKTGFLALAQLVFRIHQNAPLVSRVEGFVQSVVVVETNFRAESQVFHQADIAVNITHQALACQGVVALQGSGHRIVGSAGESRFRASIVAVDIAHRNIGLGEQRLHDHAIAAVVERNSFIGSSICK